MYKNVDNTESSSSVSPAYTVPTHISRSQTPVHIFFLSYFRFFFSPSFGNSFASFSSDFRNSFAPYFRNLSSFVSSSRHISEIPSLFYFFFYSPCFRISIALYFRNSFTPCFRISFAPSSKNFLLILLNNLLLTLFSDILRLIFVSFPIPLLTFIFLPFLIHHISSSSS